MLDRETRAVHRLVVTARDGGAPPLSASAPVTVHVHDCNDNAPVCLYPAPPSNDSLVLSPLSPPGRAVARARCTDPDLGHNARLRYRLEAASAEEEGVFEIDPDTGWITLLVAQTGMDARSYRLVVVATDGGSEALSASVPLHVHVNSSAPLDADPRGVVLALAALCGAALLTLGAVLIAAKARRGARRSDEAKRRKGRALRALTAKELTAGVGHGESIPFTGPHRGSDAPPFTVLPLCSGIPLGEADVVRAPAGCNGASRNGLARGALGQGGEEKGCRAEDMQASLSVRSRCTQLLLERLCIHLQLFSRWLFQWGVR